MPGLCQFLFPANIRLVFKIVQDHDPYPSFISTSLNTSIRFVIINPSFSNSRILGRLVSPIRATREEGGTGRGEGFGKTVGTENPSVRNLFAVAY